MTNNEDLLDVVFGQIIGLQKTSSGINKDDLKAILCFYSKVIIEEERNKAFKRFESSGNFKNRLISVKLNLWGF